MDLDTAAFIERIEQAEKGMKHTVMPAAAPSRGGRFFDTISLWAD